MSEVWYRYEDIGTSVFRHEYPVLKLTPAGVWLSVYGQKKFVLRDALKRYACPTDEQARESWLARKRKQLRILRAQIARIEELTQRPDPFSSGYGVNFNEFNSSAFDSLGAQL